MVYYAIVSKKLFPWLPEQSFPVTHTPTPTPTHTPCGGHRGPPQSQVRQLVNTQPQTALNTLSYWKIQSNPTYRLPITQVNTKPYTQHRTEDTSSSNSTTWFTRGQQHKQIQLSQSIHDRIQIGLLTAPSAGCRSHLSGWFQKKNPKKHRQVLSLIGFGPSEGEI